MKKSVKLFGKELKVGFDLYVVIQYEEAFGRKFDLTETSMFSGQLRIVYAVLIAFNDDFSMTFAEFCHAATPQDIASASAAIVPYVQRFFDIPEMAEEHVQKEEGEASPNQ